MHNSYIVKVQQKRRLLIFFSTLIVFGFVIFLNTPNVSISEHEIKGYVTNRDTKSAIETLNKISIKNKDAKDGYSREMFGNGWAIDAGCNTRNIILNRDLTQVVFNEKCEVTSGILNDPYSGKTISFIRGGDSSGDIQIDHVVALSNAWQTGAQQLNQNIRITLANDPLELLAVDGSINQQKSDGDAATWLPPNKSFRCQYVARQIAVKQKYSLWVTTAEHDAMSRVLNTCPEQQLPAA